MISFVNHYVFRTGADPTGIYTNALFDYAHFRANDCTLLSPLNSTLETPFFDNKLSDHFTTIQFLFAPLYLILGTYTLLIIQWIFLIFGGIGVFRYVRRFSDRETLAVTMALLFYSCFAVVSALAFDYHDNVLAACMFPWLLLNFRLKRWRNFALLFILSVSCKETISIWLFFVFISLAVFPYNSVRKERIQALSMAILSMGYFLIVTKLAMPALANEGRETYLHFRFSVLGNSYSDAAKFALTHPIETIKIAFSNHRELSYTNWIKTELYVVLLLSGAFAWIIKPRYLIMVFPLIAQKVFHDDYLKWGINYHYNIEFAPLLALAVSDWLMQRRRDPLIPSIGIVLLSLTANIWTQFDRHALWYDRPRTAVWLPNHYYRTFNIPKVYEALNIIPDDPKVAVSAHFNIVPHIPFHEDIYEFPIVENAEYIAVLLDVGVYPLKSQEEYRAALEPYINSADWQTIYEENHTLILKRVGSDSD